MNQEQNENCQNRFFNYFHKWWFRMTLGCTIVFLYAPIIVLVIFSFNDSRRNVTWHGFTFKYYEKALQNNNLIEAFFNSLSIAFFNTLFSLILGTLTALLLWRFRFSYKSVYKGMILVPIIIPEI